MSAGIEIPLRPARRPPGRLGVYAPWPLVGVAVLLVALIIFTPVLFSNSHHPAPGILTQAELVVDKIPGNATIRFYVWALGEEIRYAEIDIGVATSFNWTGGTPVNWSGVNWTQWYNGTGVLSEIVASSANPVALDIAAYYTSSSGNALYVGVIAFYVAVPTPSSGETLYSASATSGVTLASPYAVSSLPETILLQDVGGGPP